jgi:HAD superfamily hydrolase (TIGR01549 family)
MFYKGLILDLDNTIYDYTTSHNIALEKVSQYLLEKHNLNICEFRNIYDSITKDIKLILHGASSHNRYIYFKKLCEKLNIGFTTCDILNEIYWNEFYINMRLYDYVYEFIKWNKSIDVKIGILTDFQTEYQIKKLIKLGIIDLIDVILTSEEIGTEKPNKMNFIEMINQMNIPVSDLLYIGDNYDKDIIGSTSANIKSLFFNAVNTEQSVRIRSQIVVSTHSVRFEQIDKNYIFTNYKILHDKFNKIYNGINDFVILSKYCGDRFDLTQAGGGNISVKIDNLLIIKSSGYNLSDISKSNGYVILDNDTLKNHITGNISKDLSEYIVFGNKRPSMETYMHSSQKKYTIHLHPIQVNKILIRNDAKEIINKLFPDDVFVEYVRPGFDLAKIINKHDTDLYFLKNHGIIITGDNYTEICIRLENVLIICENYLNINYDLYKNVNVIANIIYNILGENYSVFVSEYLNAHVENIYITPDDVVYCGYYLNINDNIQIELANFLRIYKIPPQIIKWGECTYIIGKNMNKCRDIEAIFKSKRMILDDAIYDNISQLGENEINYIKNWELEKYRYKLNL